MQGLAERAQRRVDTIHQAELYRLKAERLEADLKKAREDAAKHADQVLQKDLDHALEKEVLAAHLRGTLY